MNAVPRPPAKRANLIADTTAANLRRWQREQSRRQYGDAATAYRSETPKGAKP